MNRFIGVLHHALLLGPLIGLPIRAHCQSQSPSLTSGARIRVTWTDSGIQRRTGTLLGFGPDALHLVSATPDTIRIPRPRLVQIELSQGRRRHTLHGMLVGLVASGAVVTALSLSQDSCRSERGLCFGEGAILFGVPALGLGALLGSQIRSDQWQAVPR